MADMSIARDALAPFVSSANDAVTFKLVREASDIDNDTKSFSPEFTHQFFGDNESIFGFKDLKIKLYYSAGRLTTFMNMSYKEKVNPKDFDGVEADDALSVIAEKLQPGFISNIDDFSSAIEKDKSFKPHGELIHSFAQNNTTEKECKTSTYEIYKADVNVAGFKNYHERLQTFVLWYIDAASFIDVDDDKWSFFLLYEKYKSDLGPMYAIVGYATVYAYYAYPQNLRPRISQVLIFPPFQRKGLGVELLQSIYNSYIGNPNIIDITVEDPSDNFIRLRDYVDVKNCLKLKSFSKEKLFNGFSADMINEGKKKFKLNKKQARRVYEILRLRATDMNNEEQYRKFRLDVKKRLNLPFQKEQSDLKKLGNSISAEEMKAALSCNSREQRLTELDNQYKDLEAIYRHILDRLAWSGL